MSEPPGRLTVENMLDTPPVARKNARLKGGPKLLIRRPDRVG
jgi:hypothetical protein